MRLSERQRRLLHHRARREGVGLSEALRRCLDEWALTAARPPPPPSRPPTPEERETFNQVFAALGLKPNRRARGRRQR